MLRRRHQAAPVGTIVIYHGTVAELTGRRLTITNVDTTTGRARYELSDNLGPLLNNVHAESFTPTTTDPWTARLDAIREAAEHDGCADLIGPYLAEVRALNARGNRRAARDAARTLEHTVGIRSAARTGPGAHRR
ncbi:hypothetical protein ABZS66_59870 [Dactylosporangium sp. NPDC005572]|uniref:hypothetical protein n=1 Tax=Dactylosporangium sp. NPDC005572 TaxID=3156889 RepID=UPI0033A1970E